MSSHPFQTARALVLVSIMLPSASRGNTLYDFGNPTADEQAHIEFINRARANPVAEAAKFASTTDPAILNAYSYFKVNLAMMQDEIANYPACQPLAPNAKLSTAARGHSQWMLANGEQTHYQTNPSNTPEQRIVAAGYNPYIAAENVAGSAQNPWHGHVGFEVDWGYGSGGMQTGRGHRETIHNPEYREIGVGVVNGSNGDVGPQLVTQDFADPWELQTFGTGVAYYDLNGNNIYDAGEGIAGLNVSMNGVTYYCTTAIGGGWALPVPSTGTKRNVTFAGLGINQVREINIPEWVNAKTDLKLVYTPPVITSAPTAQEGSTHTLAFTATGGATAYKWNRWTQIPATGESCDSLSNVTAATSGSYPVLNTAVKHSGTASFHLANPGTANTSQTVELKPLYRGRSTSSLKFQSRLRTSVSAEKYRVQVKEESSPTWQDVYTQDGGGTAEAGFTEKTVDLPTMAGKKFRIRFIMNFTTGSYYPGAGDDLGWFIDAISFTDTAELSNNVSETLAGTTRTFTPVAGSYLMSVAPVISGLDFPSSDQVFTVTGTAATGYAAWAATLESANSLAAGAIANYPNGDQDKDGRVNLVEYAFGTSPVKATEATPRLPSIQPGGADLKIRYVRDTALTDVTLVPVASQNLTTWIAPGEAGAPAGFSDVLLPSTGTLETREVTIPAAAGTRWFLKLRVTRQ